MVTLLFLGWGVVGYDAYNYYTSYNTPFSTDGLRYYLLERPEGYFYAFMLLFKTFISSYQVFRLINMLIDLILLTMFFNSYCQKSLLPMCFLFFFLFGGIYYEIEAIRNARAIILYVVSLKYYYGKRYLLFTIINTIAFGFHVSVVFLYIGTFFSPLFSNKKFVLSLFLIGTILLLLGIGAGNKIADFGALFLPGRLGNRVKVYLSLSQYSGFRGISVGYIERVISFIFIFYNADKLITTDKRLKLIINLFYIYIFICLFFSDIIIIYERIAPIFKFPYWILFPLAYKQLKKNYQIVFLVALLLLGLLKTYSAYNVFVYEYMFGFSVPNKWSWHN